MIETMKIVFAILCLINAVLAFLREDTKEALLWLILFNVIK